MFSIAWKQSAVERMLAGENVTKLAREFSLRLKLLYECKEQFWRGDPAGLRLAGRPRKQLRPAEPAPAAASARAALAAVQKRIAELERKVGRQASELDFFEQALRYIESRTAGTGSTPPSTSKRRKESRKSREIAGKSRDVHQVPDISAGIPANFKIHCHLHPNPQHSPDTANQSRRIGIELASTPCAVG